ncbi:hypothetical protein E0Z10_g1292 [Xylaria hypoxylon]|uniref:Uncharacterized protein n=1 Tax=Xylaria hypoxylon TaxID=37992 RepID=A0A4Z0ZD30_9PEZI|nr:hypothetical protein E0Z10_g1292 [Xylaria hypoxylon]
MDGTNQENIAPQHEVREASWKDEEEYWDNLYPESSTGDDENLTHELSYELANDCEAEYQMCPTDIPQADLEIFGAIVPALLQRTEVAQRLSVLVDKYCSDYIMRPHGSNQSQCGSVPGQSHDVHKQLGARCLPDQTAKPRTATDCAGAPQCGRKAPRTQQPRYSGSAYESDTTRSQSTTALSPFAAESGRKGTLDWEQWGGDKLRWAEQEEGTRSRLID